MLRCTSDGVSRALAAWPVCLLVASLGLQLLHQPVSAARFNRMARPDTSLPETLQFAPSMVHTQPNATFRSVVLIGPNKQTLLRWGQEIAHILNISEDCVVSKMMLRKADLSPRRKLSYTSLKGEPPDTIRDLLIDYLFNQMPNCGEQGYVLLGSINTFEAAESFDDGLSTKGEHKVNLVLNFETHERLRDERRFNRSRTLSDEVFEQMRSYYMRTTHVIDIDSWSVEANGRKSSSAMVCQLDAILKARFPDGDGAPLQTILGDHKFEVVVLADSKGIHVNTFSWPRDQPELIGGFTADDKIQVLGIGNASKEHVERLPKPIHTDIASFLGDPTHWSQVGEPVLLSKLESAKAYIPSSEWQSTQVLVKMADQLRGPLGTNAEEINLLLDRITASIAKSPFTVQKPDLMKYQDETFYRYLNVNYNLGSLQLKNRGKRYAKSPVGVIGVGKESFKLAFETTGEEKDISSHPEQSYYGPLRGRTQKVYVRSIPGCGQAAIGRKLLELVAGNSTDEIHEHPCFLRGYEGKFELENGAVEVFRGAADVAKCKSLVAELAQRDCAPTSDMPDASRIKTFRMTSGFNYALIALGLLDNRAVQRFVTLQQIESAAEEMCSQDFGGLVSMQNMESDERKQALFRDLCFFSLYARQLLELYGFTAMQPRRLLAGVTVGSDSSDWTLGVVLYDMSTSTEPTTTAELATSTESTTSADLSTSLQAEPTTSTEPATPTEPATSKKQIVVAAMSTHDDDSKLKNHARGPSCVIWHWIFVGAAAALSSWMWA